MKTLRIALFFFVFQQILPAQPSKFPPINDIGKDKTLVAFVNQLKVAVKKKDKAFLLGTLDVVGATVVVVEVVVEVAGAVVVVEGADVVVDGAVVVVATVVLGAIVVVGALVEVVHPQYLLPGIVIEF